MTRALSAHWARKLRPPERPMHPWGAREKTSQVRMPGAAVAPAQMWTPHALRGAHPLHCRRTPDSRARRQWQRCAARQRPQELRPRPASLLRQTAKSVAEQLAKPKAASRTVEEPARDEKIGRVRQGRPPAEVAVRSAPVPAGRHLILYSLLGAQSRARGPCGTSRRTAAIAAAGG